MAKEIRLKPKETYISLPTSNSKGKPELVFVDGDKKVVIKLGRKSLERLTTSLCEAYIVQNLDDINCMDMVDLVSDIDGGETEVSDGHNGTYRISDDR